MKNDSTRKINLAVGLIASLLAFNCQAEVAQATSASQKALTYESSLSDFKSISNETGELTASDSANEMRGMDHSKMSSEEMKNMDHSEMDHSKMNPNKMGADEMKGLDHSKMSPSEMQNMKAAPKKSAKPTKVKKLKPITLPQKPMPAKEAKPTAPEEASPHQNHQM